MSGFCWQAREPRAPAWEALQTGRRGKISASGLGRAQGEFRLCQTGMVCDHGALQLEEDLLQLGCEETVLKCYGELESDGELVGRHTVVGRSACYLAGDDGRTGCQRRDGKPLRVGEKVYHNICRRPGSCFELHLSWAMCHYFGMAWRTGDATVEAGSGMVLSSVMRRMTTSAVGERGRGCRGRRCAMGHHHSCWSTRCLPRPNRMKV